MRLKLVYITLAIFSVVAAGLLVYGNRMVVPVIPASVQLADNSVFSVLSGLQPGDSVSYKIMGGDQVITGEDHADDHGRFEIPLFAETPAAGRDVIYDLQITQDKKPVNIKLRVDPRSKRVALSGRGLGTFSDIEIEKGGERIKTKSDWAGTFDIDKIDLGKDLSTLEEFHVALFNANVMSEILGGNPLMIHVLETEGGGGPTDEGVNEWEEPDRCGSGIWPRLSICKTGDTNDQIDKIVENYVTALFMMTEQLTAVMMEYVYAIGLFFDAKLQMETQLQLQLMEAQAHKDYHPSEQMCVFGSFVKSLPLAEEKGKYTRRGINKLMLERYVNVDFATGSEGADIDLNSRLKQFREVYCDPRDHNHGLRHLCQHRPGLKWILPFEGVGGDVPDRLNRDIDYQAVADYPLTLDINFIDPEFTNDEEDVVALARNLYWPETLSPSLRENLPEKYSVYLDSRHVMAMHSVAHNSFAHLVSMKAATEEGLLEESSWAFMKALMREFGLSDADIHETLGENPSYYAQMEVLTKKIYQNPDFYTNLYDKPANVKRIGVSMDAIKLMQMRDWFQSSLRREMLTSLLLETGLSKQVKTINEQISSTKSQ